MECIQIHRGYSYLRRIARAAIITVCAAGITVCVLALVGNATATAEPRSGNIAAPTITLGPSGPTASSSASFAFSGETGSSFECRLDGGQWGGCSSPRYYASLAEGLHTFEVRQIDQSQNTSAPDSRTWLIDTLAPSAPPITSGPSGKTRDRTPTFTFTLPEAEANISCAIDSGTLNSCSSPYTAPRKLRYGSHRFQIQATDALGNASEIAARPFRVVRK